MIINYADRVSVTIIVTKDGQTHSMQGNAIPIPRIGETLQINPSAIGIIGEVSKIHYDLGHQETTPPELHIIAHVTLI